MNSKEYWKQREEEALEKYQKSEKEYDKEIQRIYSDMLDACNKEINAFYGKYADKEGITLAEAKKRVKKADIAEFERKAARYVKDKDFSAKANEEMRLYNTMMKINRLEMLKANIGLETIKGHDELEKFMSGILKGRTEEELARQAGILGKTVRNNAKLAHTIPNASFHNATFSDRIWQYQDLMREDLSKILSRALIQGKNPRAVAKELQKYWYGNDPKTGGGAVYCMERLMRTELARVQTEAQKQSFERNGFEEYEFIANSNCCDICKANDGKHFKVSKMMPGENAAPMHPHCRCSTAAYSDRKEYDEWLDFLEKGGTTAEWEKLKQLDSVNKLNTEKANWLKKQGYDIYGDTLEEMEAGFWEEASDGSMPKETAYIKAINAQIAGLKPNNTANQLTNSVNGSNISLKNSFKLIKGSHSIEDDIGTKTNPACNPDFKKGGNYSLNCGYCSATYEMRRRGYDVIANPKQGLLVSDWKKLFKNSQPIKLTSTRTNALATELQTKLSALGDGARGSLFVDWKGNYKYGHFFSWEVENGTVRFIDGQTGETDASRYIEMIKPTKTICLRWDDLEPSEMIKEACKNKGGG